MKRRRASLADHRRYVDARADIIIVSGPMVADYSDKRVGQFFLLEVPDRSDAESFVANDPFTIAGVFDVVEITQVETKFAFGRRI